MESLVTKVKLPQNKQFWKGKSVFITGHTGFKGSWLCHFLHLSGAKITGYALQPPTTPNMFELTNCGSLIYSIIGDIRDAGKLADALYNAQPEIVIHLAAQPLVIASYQNPLETFTTNVIGTANILEAVRQCPSVKVFINVTTDKVYENLESEQGYTESDRLGGFDPYSSSKTCSEQVTASYRKSFFNQMNSPCVGIATVRAGNVIGGGDWADNRLIPDCLRAATGGNALAIRNAGAVRPWQHVLEPLFGYLLLAQKLYEKPAQYAGAWNFGPSETCCVPVSQLVQLFCEAWGAKIKLEYEPVIAHETGFLKLISDKASQQLNWFNVWELKKTIQMVVKWFRCYQENGDLGEMTRNQILIYLEDRDKIINKRG